MTNPEISTLILTAFYAAAVLYLNSNEALDATKSHETLDYQRNLSGFSFRQGKFYFVMRNRLVSILLNVYYYLWLFFLSIKDYFLLIFLFLKRFVLVKKNSPLKSSTAITHYVHMY